MKVVGENPRNLEAKLLLLQGFIAVGRHAAGHRARQRPAKDQS
jgi:hypothetical protein